MLFAASKHALALAKGVALALAVLASLSAGGALPGTPGTPNTGDSVDVAQAAGAGAGSSNTPGARPAADMPEIRASTSLNWAGYVADTDFYTSISGTWIVPTVSSESDGADATWIGIGGVRTHDLIQTGTETLVQDGELEYRAWYELLPGDSYLLPLTIHPGDTVTASIAQDGDSMWKITVTDSTTGDSATRRVRYDSTLSSAEWIEEMPAAVGSALTLDDFGAVRFLGGTATVNGATVPLSAVGARPVKMANIDGDAVANVSDISEGGQFSVIRTTAPSSPVTIIHDAAGGSWAD